MSRKPHQVLEDARHRLPRPRPIRNLRQAPFVGNTNIDDNMLECSQIALWNALGPARAHVTVALSGGHATLTGTVQTEAERAAAEKAISALECVSGITSEILVLKGAPARSTPKTGRGAVSKERSDEPHTMVYVTRYCSLERPSITAAIRDGIAVLSAFLTAQGQAAPHDVLVYYYNQHADTVTLDIGCAGTLPGGQAGPGEIRTRALPAGRTLSATPERGLPGLLAARDALRAKAGLTDSTAMPPVWQRIPIDSDPFGTAWQPTPIHLQVESIH